MSNKKNTVKLSSKGGIKLLENRKKTAGRNVDGLTQKQADWVELVLKGVSYTDAYIQAYKPKATTPRGTISAAASRLRTKPAIAKALGEAIIEINTKQILWTREMAIIKLMKILSKAEEELEYNGLNKVISDTLLGSIKELNTIAGHYYKDQKTHEVAIAKLEIERLNYELNKKVKLLDPTEQEELEDDGFMESFKGEVANIWSEEDN